VKEKGIVLLILGAVVALWGHSYVSSHAIEGGLGQLTGQFSSTFTAASFAFYGGILAAVIGLGLLLAGSSQQKVVFSSEPGPRCPKCGHTHGADYRWRTCEECSTVLYPVARASPLAPADAAGATAECVNCGAALQPGDGWCPKCGRKVRLSTS
jgi:hypothetical protein